MQAAMVLSAGLGTRLRPLTDELPKPLMPIGDRPALAHILDALAEAGVSRAVVNTHHLARELASFRSPAALELRLSHETEILGTAGGLAKASPLLGEGDVLVWNGDIHAPSLGIAALLDVHRGSRSETTWLVTPRERGQGTVGLDTRGNVVRLRGQRFGEEVQGADFLGISVLGPHLRASLPASGCLVGDVALPHLSRGGTIATFVFEGEWHDIGTPLALLNANLSWLRAQSLPSYRAPSSRVAEGVSLDRAVISEGAVVEGEGPLRQVLVLPGAHARAPLSMAIVSARGVVALGD